MDLIHSKLTIKSSIIVHLASPSSLRSVRAIFGLPTRLKHITFLEQNNESNMDITFYF